MINRILLVVLSSLLLASCGGGGGGGGGTSTSSGSDSGSNNSGGGAQDDGFSQQQSEYLPLIDGLGWSYLVDDAGQSQLLAEESDTAGVFDLPSVIDNTDPDALVTITQKYSSEKLSDSSSEVAFHGFTGENLVVPLPQSLVDQINALNPFVNYPSLNLRLDSVLFSTPIKVISTAQALSDQLASDDISAVANAAIVEDDGTAVFNLTNLALSVVADVSNSSTVLEIENYDVNGAVSFEGLESQAILDMSGTALGLTLPFRITDTSIYVTGIGVVQRSLKVYAAGDNVNALRSIDMAFAGMNGLPEPVFYDLFQGQPVARGVLGSDITLRVDGQDPYDPLVVEILNEDAIDAVSWLSVEENESSTAYVVEMTADGIPGSTSSRVVYTGSAGSDDQIPVNVTLIAP